MDYDSNIILETERLIFRRHIASDIDAYCAMEMDPLVRRYVGGRPRTRQEAEQRFLDGAMKPVHDRLRMWAKVFKQENQYIGRCGVYQHFNENNQPAPGEGALGYYIASPRWGRGFATEAASAFVKFGFEELELNRIVTAVEVGNDASVHILEKLGFILMKTENGPRSFYHFALQNPGSNKTL